MSMIDLNDEQEQRERNYGPVPCGSKVLVRLEVQKPKYASRDDEMVAMTKSGLLQLQCKIEVCAGSYEGCWWYENITLPSRIQTIRLDENLQTACRIGGSMLRAIIESVRSIDPKASDQKATRARQINSWLDFDSLEFPVRLGIDKRPYEGKDGKTYWNNRLGSVIPCTAKEYADIMAGGEIITDGPVSGEESYKNGRQPSYGQNGVQVRESLPYDGTPPPDDDLVPF